MASDSGKLVVAFAGTLSGATPRPRAKGNIFSHFENNSVNDPVTRSGYFLFKGIKRLKEKDPAAAAKLSVRLWGLIDKNNEKLVKDLGIDDIVTISYYLPKAESVALLGSADALFLPLEAAGSHKPFALPGKMFDYLKSGKPVLLLAEDSDCTDIFLRAGTGVVCNPFDENAIADKLKYLVENKDSLGELYVADTKYINDNFSFVNLTKKLADVFNDVMKKEI